MLHFCSSFLACKMRNLQPLAESYWETQKHPVSTQSLICFMDTCWINPHRGGTSDLCFTRLETEARRADMASRIHSCWLCAEHLRLPGLQAWEVGGMPGLPPQLAPAHSPIRS